MNWALRGVTLCNKSQDVRGGPECSMHLSHKAPGCSMGGRGLRRDPWLELGGGEAVTRAGLSLEAAPSLEQYEEKRKCICMVLLMGLMWLELLGQSFCFPRIALRKKKREKGEQWLSSSSAEEIKQ